MYGFFLADFYNVCPERVCEESRVSERVSLQVANECTIYGLFSLQREKRLATKNPLDFPHKQLESYVPAEKMKEMIFRLSSLDARYKNLSVLGCTQFLRSTGSLNEISKMMVRRFLNVI